MRHLESIWRRFRHALIPLGSVYGVAMEVRAHAYRTGILTSRRPPLPVVSVGNLRLGGTGKTPFVEWLTRELASAGLRPAIVSRGYGRRTLPSQLVVVSDGRSILANAEEGGDEPVMLAHTLPGVPVVVCSDRFRACDYLHRKNMAQCVVLDDGFQHLALARDFDIVIVDESIRHERVFPAGELREPLHALARADAFVVQSYGGESTATFQLWLREEFPHRLIVEMHRAPGSIQLAQSAETVGPESLRGVRLLAFAGIAHPHRFFAALRSLGLEVVELSFEDHAHYTPGRLNTILATAQNAGCDGLITTAKDAVKLPEGWLAGGMELYVLREALRVSEGEVLLQRVKERLEI